MKKVFCIASFLLFFTNHSYCQWVTTNGPRGLNVALAVIDTNLFSGTNGFGVYLSTNGGGSWASVDSGLTSVYVRSLAVIGHNLFAGTYGGGVFLSTNNGTSWAAANTGLPSNSISTLAACGSNLFAGTYDKGVYLSGDSGATWSAFNTGLSATSDIVALVENGTNLFAVTYDNKVYRTPSNGASWAEITAGLPGSSFSPHLAVRDTNLFIGAGGSVYLSINNGASWAAADTGLPVGTNIYAFAFYGQNMFAGTWGSGVYLSTNNGTSWSAINAGLPAGYSVYSFASIGKFIFAGTNIGTGEVWRRPLSDIIVPDKPILVFPKDTAKIFSDSVILVWNKGTISTTRYWLEVSTDSLAASIVSRDTSILDTSKLIKPLANGQSYWWRVKAGNAAGWGTWSAMGSFSVTIPTATALPVVRDYAMVSFTEHNSILHYTLRRNSLVSIQIFDTRGRLISGLLHKQQSADCYSLPFSLLNRTGTFILVFNTSDSKSQRKFTVTR
jgi:hypothetical protein